MLGPSALDAEDVLKRLIARRDPIRLNAFYFRMMWSTYGEGRFKRCVEICDAGVELAYRIGTLPVQYPTIKALALMELGRFGDAWQALEQEIADEAHRFGAALRDMGKLQYEVHVCAFEAAFDRAPHVISEAKVLARAWMLRWMSNLLGITARVFAGDAAALTRIEALVASTEASPGANGRAALALAHGDFAGARRELAGGLGSDRDVWLNDANPRLEVLVAIDSAEGNWAAAQENIETAIKAARASDAKARLWRLLGERALIDTALGSADAAAASRSEAKALLTEIAATIPDPAHRASLLRGRLASRLGLMN
jgi:tetratricopeptide (TPR) repeat protein